MLKNATWLFAITTIILVAFLPAYTKLQDLKERNADYAKEIQALKNKNIELTEEKRLLEQDPIYLERVAREKMGLVREGEVVYKLMPPPSEEKK